MNLPFWPGLYVNEQEKKKIGRNLMERPAAMQIYDCEVSSYEIPLNQLVNKLMWATFVIYLFIHSFIYLFIYLFILVFQDIVPRPASASQVLWWKLCATTAQLAVLTQWDKMQRVKGATKNIHEQWEKLARDSFRIKDPLP